MGILCLIEPRVWLVTPAQLIKHTPNPFVQPIWEGAYKFDRATIQHYIDTDDMEPRAWDYTKDGYTGAQYSIPMTALSTWRFRYRRLGGGPPT